MELDDELLSPYLGQCFRLCGHDADVDLGNKMENCAAPAKI